MSSFADVFESPVKRVVHGTEYLLPRLTTRDYIPWTTKLTEERRAALSAKIPAMMRPEQKYNAERAIALLECTPDDLVPLIPVPANTIKILEMAARKAGIPEEQIDAFVDSGTSRQNMMDAHRVSGLVSAEYFLDLFPEQMPAMKRAALRGELVKRLSGTFQPAIDVNIDLLADTLLELTGWAHAGTLQAEEGKSSPNESSPAGNSGA